MLWIQLQELPWHVKGDAAGELDAGDGTWTEELRERYADRIQARLARHIPNLESSILARASCSRRPTSQAANLEPRPRRPVRRRRSRSTRTSSGGRSRRSPGTARRSTASGTSARARSPARASARGSGTLVAQQLLEPPGALAARGSSAAAGRAEPPGDRTSTRTRRCRGRRARRRRTRSRARGARRAPARRRRVVRGARLEQPLVDLAVPLLQLALGASSAGGSARSGPTRAGSARSEPRRAATRRRARSGSPCAPASPRGRRRAARASSKRVEVRRARPSAVRVGEPLGRPAAPRATRARAAPANRSRSSSTSNRSTFAPWCGTCLASPSASSCRTASRIGEMLMPSERASSSSRSGVPGASSPRMIASRSCSSAYSAIVRWRIGLRRRQLASRGIGRGTFTCHLIRCQTP